jgi:predicted nucleic acid-binding Zn ribbon protein
MQQIEKLLQTLIAQPGWEDYRRFCIVIDCWQKTADEKVLSNTRLLYIARDVLWIATSNSVWAQTLFMQRYTLLKKLNSQLGDRLSDLRFSPAQWYQNNKFNKNTQSPIQTTDREQDPNSIEVDRETINFKKTNLENNLNTAFKQWAEINKVRSQNLPLCPRCSCHTPSGELDRWGLCYLCAAQNWSHKSNSDYKENI